MQSDEEKNRNGKKKKRKFGIHAKTLNKFHLFFFPVVYLAGLHICVKKKNNVDRRVDFIRFDS